MSSAVFDDELENEYLYLIPYINDCIVNLYLLDNTIKIKKDSLIKILDRFKVNYKYYTMFNLLTKTKICLYEGKYEKALVHIETLKILCEKYDFNELDMIDYYVITSIVLYKNKLNEESIFYIKKAISISHRYNCMDNIAIFEIVCYNIIEIGFNTGKLNDQDDYIIKLIKKIRSYSVIYPTYLNGRAKSKNKKINITKSEVEILSLLNKGMTNKEISKKLNIKIDTVKFHNKNIYSKLNVTSRLKAVQVAVKSGII